MKYNVVVATHHKTGTVWMDGVFKAIAADAGVQYLNFKSHYQRLDEALRHPFVLFNYDSNFRGYGHILSRDDVRILHVIRDPRDVLISAMHYHKKSSEIWLHEPIPGYDKLTYQRTLKTLPSKFDQYVFEMENSTASTLRDVLKWHYGRSNCFEARYEDLRQDLQLAYWRRLVDFLGFEEVEQQQSAQRFWQNSLFGGLSRFRNKHVRSGAVAQWKCEFTKELAHAFIARFPDALRLLGYESDNGWISRLPRARAEDVSSALRRRIGSRWDLVTEFARGAATGF